MDAVYVEEFDAEDPAAAVRIGDRPEPPVPPGWTTVEVRAASLNHHDVFTLRGVAIPAERLPIILGSDAAGVTQDGREVLVHAVVSAPDWVGEETLDPRLSILGELHPGTFAQRVAVPERNLLPKPPELSFEQAACLPTAWLTAYRMLFTKAQLKPGMRVLVQGAAGGLGSAAVALASAAGLEVWATGRSAKTRAVAEEHGAQASFPVGTRLPGRVDAVVDAVGAPTWQHSLRCLRKGGVMVVSGGTGGYAAQVEVARVFAMDLRIAGSSMGTRDELEQLVRFVVGTSLRPDIDQVLPLSDAREAVQQMAEGRMRGKVVLAP